MSSRSPSPATASERTPLINRDEETNGVTQPKKKSRLPSLIALSLLCVAVIVALTAGFAVPAVVEEYAKEAVTFEPDNISIESFTSLGIRARIQGAFYLDADKVNKKAVRDVGKAATWIAHKVESGQSEVKVYLPEYRQISLGSARIPPVILNIRNAHYNRIDMTMDLEPGDIEGIREVAQDWMNGKTSLFVSAVATVPVKSGIFSLGTQSVTQSMHFKRGDVPEVPKFDIEKLRVEEYGLPGHPEGMKATAEVSANNSYPVKFDVPSMAFEILLPDCFDDYLMLGTMKTDVIHILPKQKVYAGATALMKQLPTSLTALCPNSNRSPLDSLVSAYLEGKQAKVYVRGGKQSNDTPRWIGELLQNIVVPAPVPVHPIENMIKNFSLAGVHFNLPNPAADPDTPEGKPKLSATVQVIVNLPKNMDFQVDVDQVRADADMYYEGQKMGKLDLREWQKSNSSKHGDELWVQSIVKDAPLEVTDQDIFSKVVQKMIFGSGGVALGVKASVDVNTATALGQFVVRKIPAEGRIFIKPIGGEGFTHTIQGIEVVGSSPEALIMEARVQVINPTEYSARIPYVNVSLWHNETRLGYGWGSFDIGPGANNMSVRASWNTGPVGSELLSQYISGENTTLTIRTHANSIPGMPDPELNVTVPMPHVFGTFLRETTMHILSSSATFILSSPIAMYVTWITASAVYNGTEIGTIEYDMPFAVVAGDTETPRLPVAWNTNGGFKLIREALGGSLKLDAKADVGVRIGQWQETIWYQARGIGAKVRL